MRHLHRAPDALPRSPLWQRTALNAGAALGTLCLLFAALTAILGLTPLIFASGSMAPAIPEGSFAVARTVPVSEVAPGHVVSVITSDGTRLTHRVVSADPETGLVLKGDANAVPDLQPYLVETVEQVVVSVPGLGYVVSWFARPWVVFLGGLFCAYVLFLAFGRGPEGPAAGPHPPRRTARAATGRGRRRRSAGRGLMARKGAVFAAVAALLFPAGAVAAVVPTQAAFTATGTATAGVAAATMPRPGALTCLDTANVQDKSIGWSAPAGSISAVKNYRMTVTISEKTSTELLAPSARSKVLSMRDKTGLLGSVLGLLVDILDLLITYDYPVQVSVTALYANGWESAPSSYTGLRAVNGGLLGGGKKLVCA